MCAPQVTQMLQPVVAKNKLIRANVIMRLGGSRPSDIIMVLNFGGRFKSEDIIYPPYMCGKCSVLDCVRAHLFYAKCLEGYENRFVQNVSAGVLRYLAGERA